jgi:predicted transcriptional regulator of viral defense system
MARIKYIKEVQKAFLSPVVTTSSVSLVVKKLGGSKKYASLLMKKLVEKNVIKRITKGYYTAYDDPSLLVLCLAPAYLGLQDALSLHGLWEQETIPVIITSRAIRQGIRKVFGHNVLVRRLNKKYLFGFDYFKHDSFYLPVSDIEKTFIDLVYFRQPISKELLRVFKKRINRGKLEQYLKRYPTRFRKRVLNLLGK